MDAARRLAQTRRALLVVGVLWLGSLGAGGILWRAAARGDAGHASSLDDAAVRSAAIAELVAMGGGCWDTFPDPEVGRILQPNLSKRKWETVHLTTNDDGLREAQFARPKVPGTIRVVLLGDSFVLGQTVEADDRLGVFLHEALMKRSANKHYVECLHFGMTSWNIVNETAFLRRQLALVQPDLVIHVIVRNDLEDNPGVRGFGAMSRFDPLHGERGDGLFQARGPTAAFGTFKSNWIANGLDWESRTRLEDAGRRIADLARRVEAMGGRYLLVDYYEGLLATTRDFITTKLAPAQVCYLPTALIKDERFRISQDDAHWNRAGHELVASVLYSVIRSRRLIPRLELAEWPQADAAAKEWLEKGEREAAGPNVDEAARWRRIRSKVDFDDLDGDAAAQVTGGIAPKGLVGPYAALVLKGGGRRLEVRAHGLPRPEIDGTRVTVFVEEAKVGEFTLKARDSIALTFDVPTEVSARPFVAVRFSSDDFAYSAEDLRQHVVFQLDRVALTGS